MSNFFDNGTSREDVVLTTKKKWAEIFRAECYIENLNTHAHTEFSTEQNTQWKEFFTHLLMNVSCHEELASGTRMHASDAALITKSFTESLIPSFSRTVFSFLRKLKSDNTS